MMFTFKRNAEGEETIHVGDVPVAKCLPLCTRHDGEYIPIRDVPGVDGDMIVEAIERADEAGFWAASVGGADIWVYSPVNNEVTVEVPSC